MASETVAIADLTCDPANVRRHGERNLEAIKASLVRFGQQKPIVVDKDGVVIAGNGTVQAARILGWDTVDVVRSNLIGAERTAYAIADNRSAELAEWDSEALAETLAALQNDESIDELVAGFDANEIQRLIDEQLGGDVEEDEPPAVQDDAITNSGDLWMLGKHRLMCGDSTKVADAQRLMNGAKAQLAATDPPYLVDYTGERPNDSGKDWSDTYHEIDIKDADGFYRTTFQTMLTVIDSNTAIYCWHAHKRAHLIAQIWSDLGILNHQQIIWLKPTAVFGRVYWHFRHEPCMMGWVQGSMPPHDGRHEHDSVWEIDWQGKARVVGNEHPTQKPVEIFARPMRKHTIAGAICYEPFSGSGSQIIAAEQLDRVCYAMEIEPRYVDVACRRWMKLTGNVAVREGDGAEFPKDMNDG